MAEPAGEPMEPAAAAPNAMELRIQAFDTVLTEVVELTNPQVAKIHTNQVQVVEHLALLDIEAMLGIFPSTGNHTLGAMQKMKLKALREWVKDTAIPRLHGEGHVNAAEFTEQICEKLQSKIAGRQKGDKTEGSGKSSYSGSLGEFSGKAHDWTTANRKLLSYLGQIRGNGGNIPLIYVLRDDDARPDYLDEVQEEIWDAPLQGRSYDTDNYQVYQILKQWTADGTADTHVDMYQDTQDGRSAYQRLLLTFEGEDARQSAIAKARSDISNAHYTQDTTNFFFDDYCTKHLAANNELERRGVPLDGPSQVLAFLNGIRRETFSDIKPGILANARTKNSLVDAVAEFKSQIRALKHYDSLKPPASRRFDRRHIGMVQRGNGRGGGPGRGGQRGGSQFFSRGGRGGGRFGRGGGGRYYGSRPGRAGRGGHQYPQRGRHVDPNEYEFTNDQLSTLSDIQRQMLYIGRDEMRKRQTGNRNDQRSVKFARTNDETDNNSTQEPPSDVTQQGSTNTSASSRFGPRSLNNRSQKALKTTPRRHIGQVERGHNHELYNPATTTDYNGRYRLEIDSRADTMCCGKGFVPVGDTDNVCSVSGFHPAMPAIENVSIRTCATAFDHEDGETLILVFGQALWFGDDLEQSLACPGQIRSFNNIVCLNPKQFTDGKSLHGIHSNTDDVTMHFRMHGCISYLPIRTPTTDELHTCRWIYLTSEDQWEPYHDNFARAEDVILDKSIRTNKMYDDTSKDQYGRAVYATSSKDHRSNVPPDTLARRWGTSIDIASKTLKITTQRGIRNLASPLTRRFRTRQTHLRYNHLRTDVFSDTLFSETKSARGYECGQLFVTAQDFAEFYPRRSKAEAPYKLDLFCKTHGLPQTIITDNAMEETRGEWNKVVTQYLLKQRTTEPYSGWQNRAKLEIRELKKHFRRIMHRNRCPEVFWCYGMEYAKDIRKFMAKPTLDWRSPLEVLKGETPDCSEFLEFDFYGWVKYRDPKAKMEEDIALGRWLGVAHDVGQAMTYWILKSNGEVIARSSVRPITLEEQRDEEEKIARKAFMEEVKKHVGDFDPELIITDEDNDEMEEPRYVGNDDENEPDEDEKVKQNELMDAEPTPGPEPLLYAEVFLPHGDRTEIAKVIGRKRNADGNYIGRKHQNPMLDSRVFIVEFPDGDQKDIAYNIIAEHLFSQVDSEGNQYRIFKEIVNHRKKKTAVDRSDQFRADLRTGRQTKKRTTAGWDLEVEWKDGSTSWLPLKELKETNSVEVAQYAVDNQIDEEPAFDWWVRPLLKKKERLIKASKRKHVRVGYKFGVKIPNTVEEAMKLDEENGDTLWFDAIQKEMTNVRIAFEILNKDDKPPPGYKKIPCRMIFTLKMDFTRKARLVAGGHVTDPPSSITYSSVVSRESVRIMFLIAALNDLDKLAGDIGNAYLNAKTMEKVYIMTGTEFGEDAGKIALIVRALYGLKSSGAAWHAHFAEHLTNIGFIPCKSDPDVWRRPATKKDGAKYYEYIVVYVDDLLAISETPEPIIKQLQEDYNYKINGVGSPETFLGARVGSYEVKGKQTWFISAEAYLEKAIPNIEQRFGGKLESMFAKSKLDTPAPVDFHPELDTTDFLDADGTALYQSYIGIIRWAVELGRIDIAHFAGTMAKYSTAPRQGHLTAVVRCMAYLKKHLQSRIVFNPEQIDFSDLDWTSKDCGSFYPDIRGELLPHDMPEPRGKPVQIHMFCDAAHATDLITRRSTTGIIFFLNGTPIIWYSKRQNTIESSTFGSEFVALKIAGEMNDALRYKLRMFGIPVDGATNGFCDNQSVVTNVTNPESTLKKRHNSIAYHKVRECVAAKALRILHENGKDNCSDVLTKFLPREAHYQCCSSMLYR